MSESRHSKGGDAANVVGETGKTGHVGAVGATGHVDEFRNVPTDKEFVGELDEVETWPYALDPDEIAEHFNRTKIEREQRRKRRHRLERIRAWVILVGAVLFLSLMFSPLPGIYPAVVLLLVSAAAIALRRAGR